jgi:hypothetical protein
VCASTTRERNTDADAVREPAIADQQAILYKSFTFKCPDAHHCTCVIAKPAEALKAIHRLPYYLSKKYDNIS